MFSKNLRKLREFKNIDRNELADTLGLTYQAIAQYENGTREPNFDILKRISLYFGITIDYLINGEDENVNSVKIKNLIKKLNYSIKEFSQDIGESTHEIEKIVLDGIEPSEQIINSVCEKYSIPYSEFERKELTAMKNFCTAEENRKYIEIAVFIKNSGLNPDSISKILSGIAQLLNEK